jgi:glycosyltransferase involved in cell wall biosynthesis
MADQDQPVRERAGPKPALATHAAEPELSVVMPCLNEADTLGICIEKAQRAMAEHGIDGEVIVADNGSTDGSQDIAELQRARVVRVTPRGYGSALRGGIAAARGRYILMGDADDSYDFRELPAFVAKLREGNDLVQGCRLERGGGRVLPGAMPFLHRRWGNPMFSAIARSWFRAPVSDIYCGMRAFTKRHYEALRQRCTGMEFATEMIIKSSLQSARIAEVPITLHPDGRKAHPPHLRTFRDGWRTLRFFLVYSPRWLFLVPGLVLILLGAIGYAVAMPAVTAFGVTFDAHTLLFASLALICGFQSVTFGIFTKVFAVNAGLLPPDTHLQEWTRRLTLERVLALAVVGMIAGVALLALAVLQWRQHDFGRLDYADTMRLVVPGVTLTALGLQSVLAGFFISVLGIDRR